ncbi:MAG: ATPase, T2SS/T4P/T4SS family [Candidatus Berkelbacteria bacterium]
MNRNDLAKALAKQAKLSLDDAEKLIVSFGDTIAEVLQKKEKVIYSNFGTFYTVHYPSKVIYHPVLGKKKQMVMLPTDAVKWMPSGNIKELVQTSQEVESATAFGATKKHKEENRKAGIAEIKARELTDDEVSVQEEMKKQQAEIEDEEYTIPIKIVRTQIVQEQAPTEILDFENVEANSVDRIEGEDIQNSSLSLENLFREITQSGKKDISYIDLEGIEIPEESFSLLPKEIIRNFRVLPLSVEPDHIVVAMTHPDDQDTIKLIEGFLKKKILPKLSSTSDIEKYLKKFEPTEDQQLPEIQIPADQSPTTAFLTLSNSSSPIIRLVNMIITRAIREEASEIHFEPQGSEVAMIYRLDHALKNITVFPKDIATEIIGAIKNIGQMDPNIKSLPQTGYFKQKYNGYTLRFNISTLPISDGEKIVIKITNKLLELKKLEELGLLGNDLQTATTACQKLHGLILLTGPENSGKSTTFYSILDATYFEGINITSLEDPIECKIKRIDQSEIDDVLGYDFNTGIDSVLRQDPDVLAVSEITTKKIAGKLLKASTNGRMVVATMKSGSLDEALSFLLSNDLDPTLVFSAINLIINQRLVKKLCNHCKEEIELTEQEKKLVRAEIEKMPSVEKEILRKNGLRFYHGKGCSRCHHTGYKGLMGLFELYKLPKTTKKDAFAKLDRAKLKSLVYAHTMDLLQDGILKASLGLTTIDEVLNSTNK